MRDASTLDYGMNAFSVPWTIDFWKLNGCAFDDFNLRFIQCPQITGFIEAPRTHEVVSAIKRNSLNRRTPSTHSPHRQESYAGTFGAMIVVGEAAGASVEGHQWTI